ncbi:MAG TPA: hypothetical protein VF529_01840 [Solirubrobacteraceae bacterium]|jgi:hypothetical protein
MRLRSLAAALAATLLVAASASAADPVPGALYEGTTEDGNPFQFRVSDDGKAVTDLLSAISITCVGSQGGVEVKALAQQTPFTVSPGDGTITGVDEAVTPRLEMNGTFTSPTEASGRLLTSFAKFDYSGGGLTSCLREFTWTARTSSAAPGGGGGDAGGGGGEPGGPGDPGPAPPAPPSVTPPATTPAQTTTAGRRARAIKRCKRIKKRAKRSKCLRRARRIRG